MVDQLSYYTTDKLDIPESHSFKYLKEIDEDVSSKLFNIIKSNIKIKDINKKYTIIVYNSKEWDKCTTWLLTKDLL